MMRWRILMEQQYKCVVFDLDGTLLDTSEGVVASVQYTIEKYGLPKLSEEQLDSFIGPPIQNSFAIQYGLEGPILQELATTFRNQYKNVDLLKAKPYDGIFDVFQTLVDNNIIPAIATYKRQDYAITILKHFGFDKYTDIMLGADHENKLKKKDIIELALKKADIHVYSNAIMVGDSDNDAIGAEQIGTKFVGVTYGFGFKKIEDVLQYPAIAVADTPSELKQILIRGIL